MADDLQNFQVNFCEWNILTFKYNFIHIYSRVPTVINSALVQVRAWCQTGDEPLSWSEDEMIELYDTICGHNAAVS